MAEALRSQPQTAEAQPLWQLAIVEGVFVLVAGLIIYLRHSAGQISFVLPATAQLAIGVPLGGALGVVISYVALRSVWRASVIDGVLPLRAVTAAAWSIVVVGILAGVGEELLFRAALQPWIGIWWTSLLFGIAHSGTARLHEGLSLGKVVYLLFAVGAGVMLGLLYGSAGLLASIAAHASYDIGTLSVLAPAIAAWRSVQDEAVDEAG